MDTDKDATAVGKDTMKKYIVLIIVSCLLSSCATPQPPRIISPQEAGLVVIDATNTAAAVATANQQATSTRQAKLDATNDALSATARVETKAALASGNATATARGEYSMTQNAAISQTATQNAVMAVTQLYSLQATRSQIALENERNESERER